MNEFVGSFFVKVYFFFYVVISITKVCYTEKGGWVGCLFAAASPSSSSSSLLPAS